MATQEEVDIAEQFNRDFEYVRDHIQWDQKEHWRVPKEDDGEAVMDDCDGYATGMLYRLVGRDLNKFWEALDNDDAAIVKVWAIYRDGTKGESHAVLRWGDEYIDNIYPWFRDDLKHELRWEYSVEEVNARMNELDKWDELEKKSDEKRRNILIIGGLAILGVLAFVLSQNI